MKTNVTNYVSTMLNNKIRNQSILSINMEESSLFSTIKLHYFVVKQHYLFNSTVTVRWSMRDYRLGADIACIWRQPVTWLTLHLMLVRVGCALVVIWGYYFKTNPPYSHVMFCSRMTVSNKIQGVLWEAWRTSRKSFVSEIHEIGQQMSKTESAKNDQKSPNRKSLRSKCFHDGVKTSKDISSFFFRLLCFYPRFWWTPLLCHFRLDYLLNVIMVSYKKKNKQKRQQLL